MVHETMKYVETTNDTNIIIPLRTTKVEIP